MSELPENQILHGNCLEVLRTLPDACIDSVTTDPPYGLGNEDPTPEELLAYLQGADLETGDFMDKPWNIPSVAVWKECFRVLKPGGHLLAFAGTRTQDLMAMGIRMAGFENRDTIATMFGPVSMSVWAQSQGFPKNHDVSANIDRKLGMQREVIGTKRGVGGENLNDIVQGREVRQTTDEGGKGIGAYGVGAKQVGIDIPVTAPASEQAKQWEGWGSALKPSFEPILMFRKPVAEKTVVDQVLKTGTGAINIGGCRIGYTSTQDLDLARMKNPGREDLVTSGVYGKSRPQQKVNDSGRWPANLILVHGDGCKIIGMKKVKAPLINRFEDGMKPWGDGAGHDFTSTRTGDENGEEEIPVYECMEGCPAKLLDAQSGTSVSRPDLRNEGSMDTRNGNKNWRYKRQPSMVSDAGGASRFFAQFMPDAPFFYCAKASSAEKTIASDDGELLEDHPTVKPLKLMAYLVRLVTPPKGIVLDPYCGSGTTCVAAVQEGIRFIGIDKHEPYVKRSRIRTREALGQAEEKTAVQSVFDLAMSDDG